MEKIFEIEGRYWFGSFFADVSGKSVLRITGKPGCFYVTSTPTKEEIKAAFSTSDEDDYKTLSRLIDDLQHVDQGPCPTEPIENGNITIEMYGPSKKAVCWMAANFFYEAQRKLYSINKKMKELYADVI